jgi:hypothetical protein
LRAWSVHGASRELYLDNAKIYHQQPNSETGQSPLDRYHQGQRFTRHVNLQEVLKYGSSD